MSYYTNIYLDPQVLGLRGDMTEDELREKMTECVDVKQKISSKVGEIWTNINGYCFATPRDTNYGDLMGEMGRLLDRYLGEFKEKMDITNTINIIDSMIDNIRWRKELDDRVWKDEGNGKDAYGRTEEEFSNELEEERRELCQPYLWWNHFPYTNDPEGGMEELNDTISNCRVKLVAMSVATPNDIVGDTDRSVIDVLADEIKDIKDMLDSALWERNFCEMMVKYPDNITRG